MAMNGICKGITKAGIRCKLAAKRQKEYCHMHLPVSSISINPSDNYREELSDIEEVRDTFIGKFKRIGSKPGTLTVLLVSIVSLKEPNKILSDHSWFNLTKGFKELGHLNENDKISFTARVKRYEKGTKGNETFDYKFSIPLNVKRV
jgi:hypothetical protein